jgi:probable rRNA maturation factor
VTTTLFNQQRDLPISTESVERVVSFLLQALKIHCDEVILHFVTKRKICQTHQIFFNDPAPTDCISFPLDPPKSKHSGHTILGEIFICPKVAIEYGKEHGLDAYEEATRYLVHGLLHLIGFDDIIPEERSRMRRKENQCMKLLSNRGILIQK